MSQDVYDYADAAGGYLFTVVVEREPDGTKRVLQGIRNGEGYKWGLNGRPRVLYHFDELTRHLEEGRPEPIWLVEGEKDAETLRGLGQVATTNPMGAGKWSDDYTDALAGARHLIVVADNDEPGRAHARAVYDAVFTCADEIELLTVPADLGEHADVSDLIATGRSLDELIPLDPREPTPPHSWRPIDLVARAATPLDPPSIGGLVYAGLRHVFSGEPEALKTWAAAVLTAEEVAAGRHVVYVDAENGAAMMLERFRALGLDDEAARRILYVAPEEPLADPGIVADVDQLLTERAPTLIILDSFDALLGLHGLDPNSTVEVEGFWRARVDPLRKHGAAIVLLDHVGKAKDTRGRFSIGSQRKSGAADVHLGFEVAKPFGRGRTGLAKLTTHKDRHGHLARPKAAELELTSDSDTHRIAWTIRHGDPTDEPHARFRPTTLMERVSIYVGNCADPPSRNAVEEAVKGKRDYVRQAIDALVFEGYLEEQEGSRGARLLTHVRPFRESADPDA